MNELFEFRKHLNIKKLLITIGILLLIIFIIIKFWPQSTQKKLEKEAAANPYKTFSSSDKSFSLELPKRYNLTETYDNDITYLKSDDGLQIKIEEKTIVVGKSLNDIASSDKKVYTAKFENAYNISDLKSFSLENGSSLSSYKYDFSYAQNNSEYNIQVFWIQGNSNYYIITLCIPANVASNYQSIETEIISSFKAQ